VEQSEKRPFKLHLPGLLKVLAEHLYSTKKVAIRELIQNAHDSCIRRTVEGKEPFYRPKVNLSVDQARRTLTISDNGSGLSATDIDEYLATIGRSYTRELGEKLSILAPDTASELIGQFGLGFLSAFLIAAEVRLTTKALQSGSQAILWRSVGDEHYEVTPATRDDVGTTIEIQVKSSASFILQEQILIETIQEYADFLPIPIYVGYDPTPVNLMTPPWEAIDPQRATLEYIQRAFNQTQPLCIIPLKDQTIDLGHDTMVIPMNGFLFVPPKSIASIHEYGDLKVFIRRMFICDGEKDLLPSWARFVRGIIDCTYLQPTASRESVHQDDNFIFVQQALETQLGEGLKQIAENDPATWRRIVRGHADVIIGWAVTNNEFFERVADIVTFRTTRGELNLPDYLKLTDDTLYYVTKELGSLQEQLLAEGHNVPVIDASWFAVAPFLHKYADWRPGIKLSQLDGESRHMLRPVSEDDFSLLLAYYRNHGIRAKIAAFKPTDVPALMYYPQDAEFIIETRNALDSGEIASPMAGLISDYIQKINPDEEELKGTLYLNASCGIIRQLAGTEVSDPARQTVLMMLYQIARLFSGRTLTAADATGAFRDMVQSIERLIKPDKAQG
jgi:molecular chaperone HtpG